MLSVNAKKKMRIRNAQKKLTPFFSRAEEEDKNDEYVAPQNAPSRLKLVIIIVISSLLLLKVKEIEVCVVAFFFFFAQSALT